MKSTCVTEAEYLINLANLKGHSYGEMGIYSPLTDLMANEQLGGKTVLYMLDALICATSEGASITEETARWQQTPFDVSYTSSVFVSQDPVAIDSVGADILINEPAVTEHMRRNNINRVLVIEFDEGYMPVIDELIKILKQNWEFE